MTWVWMILLTAMVEAGCSSVPERFAPLDPLDPAHVSHRLFDEVLQTSVKNGIVNYPEIQADQRLTTYMTLLNRVDPSALNTDRHRLAFWINAYNAFAIKGILDGYSPTTLWGRYRYFIGREYEVGGETINLYDLERRVLVPMGDPRIHFAIVCASRSCPKLQPWAYRSDRLEEQLEQVTRAFVNDPSRNRFDPARRVAYLSKIFDWFHEDFASHAGSVQEFVSRYLDDPALAKDVAAVPYAVEYLEYDWHLNGVSPRQADYADSSS